MNPEIEKLIRLAVADCNVTEKERDVIMRKASSLGEDKDEVELILDGELAIKKEKKSETQPPIKSNKEGELRKCPSCGAPVQSFTTKCSECDYEYQNREASNSISELYKMLVRIESEERSKPEPKGFFAFDKKNQMESGIARRLAGTIAAFPIPTAKTDILEFLSQAISKSEILSVRQMFNGYERNYHNTIATAWNNKCKEIIMKARFSMKDDKELLNEIEKYAKELNIG